MAGRLITFRRIYQQGGANFQHQVVLTLALVIAASISVCAYAIFAIEAPTPSAQWITPANIIAAAGVLFSLGMLREQFGEVKRRLEQLEEFNRKTLADTYARKDVIAASAHERQS